MCTVKQISDNEIYLLIKYIKSFLWRVAKRLSYIEDAKCLKVKGRSATAPTSVRDIVVVRDRAGYGRKLKMDL